MKQKIRPWLCIRKFSIGASALGGIIGQSDWIHSEEAMERYLKPQPFSWWAQRSINHGARYESVATIMFQNEFQNSLLSEGETFELLDYGMIKCNTYPGLHCSPDGVVHHTLKDGTILYRFREGKAPERKRDCGDASVAQPLACNPKLMEVPAGTKHSNHDARLPVCAVTKARDRWRGRIHRQYYTQVQVSAFCSKKLLVSSSTISYSMCVLFRQMEAQRRPIISIPIDRAYGRWCAERGKEMFEKNRERILDRDRLRFLPSPSTTRRSKRLRSKKQRKKKLRIKKRKGSRLAKSGEKKKLRSEMQPQTRRGN